MLKLNPLKYAKDFVNSTNGKITISSICLIIFFVVAIVINNQNQKGLEDEMFKIEDNGIEELKKELKEAKEGLLSMAFHPVGIFGLYLMAEQPMTFYEGQTYCQERFGSHILEFEDSSCRSQVELKITTLKRRFGQDTKQHNVFIGLSDIDTKGVWKWITSANILPTVSPSFWSLGSPENLEDCAYINIDGKFSGYKDTSCKSQFTIICELALDDQEDSQQ